MAIAGLTIGGIALVAALVFGIWNIRLSVRELREQNDIAKGIQYACEEIKTTAEGTLKAIEKDGAESRRTIEKDGAESRRTIEKDGAESRQDILAVHKSIKEELGK